MTFNSLIALITNGWGSTIELKCQVHNETNRHTFSHHWRPCLLSGGGGGSWGGGKVCPWEGIFNAAQHRKRKLGDPAEAKSQLFICRLWEIVLLTSSSFKAHVHLLHVVIVNQAFRLCAFSQVFHLPCVLALRRTVFRIIPPSGNDRASLKSWFGLLNYFNKYQTGNSAQSVYLAFLCSFGLRPPAVSPEGADFTHIC